MADDWRRDETYFCIELLKRINSSCSSGRERRKSVSGMEGRLMRPQIQGNLEMVKYCVANECPIDEYACAYAADDGQLEVPQILTRRSQSALGFETASYAAEMVIFIYSNILLSVSMMNIANMRVSWRPSTATWTV